MTNHLGFNVITELLEMNKLPERAPMSPDDPVAEIAYQDKYLDKDYNEIDDSRISAAKVIALFVSAEWWPGTHPFKAKLLQYVTELKSEGHKIEVINLSGDRGEGTFKDQLTRTTWMTVPYNTHSDWIDKINIDGYPYLRFLNNDGSVALYDAYPALIS